MDNSSADYYLTLPGTLGDALRLNLKKDDEGWHFRLDQEERCPFLQKSGLCRIICELGEESLCDICALHPRFYGSLGEWEFCGLGLSCEAVVMLLTQSEATLKYRIENEMLECRGDDIVLTKDDVGTATQVTDEFLGCRRCYDTIVGAAFERDVVARGEA